MANNYFDFLEQNAQPEQPANVTPSTEGEVYLTTRADAECQVVCDGDFLFLLNPNQITKEKAPVGQHILQYISTEYPDIIIEKVVDFPEIGKNYLVMVNEFSALISAKAKQAEAERAALEAKALADSEEARRKAEQETVVTIVFVAKLGGKGKYTGHLKDGKPEGIGRVDFESGCTYEGAFLGGWRHGKGVYRFSDGRVYEGDNFEDMRTGKGKLIGTDGRIWEGDFLNGKVHGKCKLSFSNGDVLEGTWENDNIVNKPVKYYWPSGDMLECEGWDGGLNGHGLYHFKNGVVREEFWNHGKRDKVGPSDDIQMVDLGLSVKWANQNFGATYAEDLGDPVYFGDQPCTQEYLIFEGSKFRFPTSDEMNELIEKCQWSYSKYIDSKGNLCNAFKVTSPITGNSIILPFSVMQDLSGGEYIQGNYWTGTPDACNYNQHYMLDIKGKDKAGLKFISGGTYSDGFVRLVAK